MIRRSGRPAALAVVACALLLADCGARRPGPPATPGTVGTAAAPDRSRLTPEVARLRHSLDRILDTPDLESGTWGVAIRSLRSGDVFYAKHPRKLLTPASTLKIVTLAAAAERLGWDFTYETEVLGLGAIDFGFLDGDLIVRGSGDPSLSDDDGTAARVFRTWAERLKALGVRVLSGRIIGDDNAFDDEGYGAGWMWDDMDQAYAAGIGALQLNVDATVVTVTAAGTSGGPATVSVATDASGLAIHNRVVTAPAGTPARVTLRRRANSTVLDVSGEVPAGGDPVSRRIAVVNPTRYFVEELRKALIANGIDVQGPAVDIDDLEVPPHVADAVPLLVHRSPSLRTLAETMMKVSQNQYAETLLKTLGAQVGIPTFAGGRDVVLQLLDEWGIPTGQLVLADGSGLSRYNLISAEALTAVLARVAQSAALEGPFRAALPVAGGPGMLASRLLGTPAAGVIQAKTGSMRHTRSIAGYARTADGEPLAFAILANNYGVPPAEVDRAADAILLAVSAFRR
ncbi:MAG: D-alanyl-D-alanine carboxypeptidase/D-alanyl-D-alanine-endopeptidase [Vicinamibacterales bacterium]